jgi:hypothetical protein
VAFRVRTKGESRVSAGARGLARTAGPGPASGARLPSAVGLGIFRTWDALCARGRSSMAYPSQVAGSETQAMVDSITDEPRWPGGLSSRRRSTTTHGA